MQFVKNLITFLVILIMALGLWLYLAFAYILVLLANIRKEWRSDLTLGPGSQCDGAAIRRAGRDAAYRYWITPYPEKSYQECGKRKSPQ